jgi:hypothetical protein
VAFIFWLFYRLIKKTILRIPFLKFIYLFMLITLSCVTIYFWGSTIATYITKNGAEIVLHNYQVYKSVAETEGSGSLIKLSDIDMTSLGGIVKFLPTAFVNVFFRPWPWEISNVLMIFTVLENLFFLFLFLKFAFKSRLFTRGLNINGDFQIFAIVFSISLALVIGMSTFNFGTMVRYKMPFLPFWACFLLVANAQKRKKNATNLENVVDTTH